MNDLPATSHLKISLNQANLILFRGSFTGVGTRNYYRKIGYELEGPYMVKNLWSTSWYYRRRYLASRKVNRVRFRVIHCCVRCTIRITGHAFPALVELPTSVRINRSELMPHWNITLQDYEILVKVVRRLKLDRIATCTKKCGFSCFVCFCQRKEEGLYSYRTGENVAPAYKTSFVLSLFIFLIQ